jgi:hypothetical protein
VFPDVSSRAKHTCSNAARSNGSCAALISVGSSVGKLLADTCNSTLFQLRILKLVAKYAVLGPCIAGFARWTTICCLSNARPATMAHWCELPLAKQMSTQLTHRNKQDLGRQQNRWRWTNTAGRAACLAAYHWFKRRFKEPATIIARQLNSIQLRFFYSVWAVECGLWNTAGCLEPALTAARCLLAPCRLAM